LSRFGRSGLAPGARRFARPARMVSRQSPRDAEPLGPRLYIVTPPVRDASLLAASLEPLLDAGDVAALLLRSVSADEALIRRHVETIAPLTRRRGTALMIEAMPELAARSAADGAHVPEPSGLSTALKVLKPDRVVGAGGLKTRHDAMVAGEMGADYVMFGEPDATGRRPSLDALLERVAWWAALFEPPCVAFATSLDEASHLAAAGADFVAAGDLVWQDAAGPASGLSALAARLGTRESV
jgi:thiamine-phosphate pyrophosphorylase